MAAIEYRGSGRRNADDGLPFRPIESALVDAVLVASTIKTGQKSDLNVKPHHGINTRLTDDT